LMIFSLGTAASFSSSSSSFRLDHFLSLNIPEILMPMLGALLYLIVSIGKEGIFREYTPRTVVNNTPSVSH
jgi:hypothetical protein